jgi:hypothetical protein
VSLLPGLPRLQRLEKITTMYQKQLELLRLLLDATRGGRAVWRRDGNGSHHSELAGLPFLLRFKCPLLAGDDGSDPDAEEVTADRTVSTFYSGSEGFDLVSTILSAAYPEIREHNQFIVAQLDETIEKMRKHIQ